jgi:hypothetical protein
MRHVPVVHLRGIDSSLGNAMIERLLRTHVQIVVPQSSVDMLTDRFSVDLEFGECELFGSGQVPLEAGHRLFLMGLGPFNLSSDDGPNIHEYFYTKIRFFTPALSALLPLAGKICMS